MTKREKTSGGRVLLRRYGIERIDGKWLVTASSYGDMTIIEARAEAKRRNAASARAHIGDPCRKCGVGHDDVAVGDCPGVANGREGAITQ